MDRGWFGCKTPPEGASEKPKTAKTLQKPEKLRKKLIKNEFNRNKERNYYSLPVPLLCNFEDERN